MVLWYNCIMGISLYNTGGVSMFIETIKNNGKPYLRLVHAIRKPNKNGDMVSTKNVMVAESVQLRLWLWGFTPS